MKNKFALHTGIMACVENMQLIHGDYEREEGEIVDELDELSDISSEEEFLLRQRLQVLENYNNVLERKKAKRTSIVPGKNKKHSDDLLCDLSEISATELDDPYVISKDVKQQKQLKTNHKAKRRKDLSVNHLAKREHRKKSHKYKKKVVLSDSSAESEDEYRNKRRKLEEAVAVNKTKIDKTSLKARLAKMLHGSHNHDIDTFLPNCRVDYELLCNVPIMSVISSENNMPITHEIHEVSTKNDMKDLTGRCESVDLCSDSEAKDCKINGSVESLPRENENMDTVKKDSLNEEKAIKDDLVNEQKAINESEHARDSDEDLELLRQHALKTKISKTKTDTLIEKDNAVGKKSSIDDKEDKDDKAMLLLSEDEDSDTTELRLICLKSALLKKAIEMKQKQKLRKRLQSANLNEELLKDQTEYMNKLIPENSTDTESVDMDIGSDADERTKESSEHVTLSDCVKSERNIKDIKDNRSTTLNNEKEDEFEEDEDLLRANLLTSLSKNLPNLVDPKVMKTIDDPPQKESEPIKQINNQPEEKRFIINIGNSDSEGEHEATKNLTKMHMKLSEQTDFQQKLDLFLKSTRMQVENNTLPDLVQKPLETPSPKKKEKFVPKAVKHLPKSEQIEYKNLVKRMAELEKIKNARQSSIINLNKAAAPNKDTLKPRNVTIDSRKLIPSNVLDEQIAQSRKTIAQESAKVLKLKEEALKLSQKYKIVATELHNISTAIILNKKEQRSAQIRLSKIRAQHKLLLNSSTTKHCSNSNIVPIHGPEKAISTTTKRTQKENDPKEDFKNPKILRTVQVSVVNDYKANVVEPNPRLSIQVDITSNKKTVKIPKGPGEDFLTQVVETGIESRMIGERKDASIDPLDDRGRDKNKSNEVMRNWGSRSKMNDDYKSPLQALGTANWEEDPNGVLCPFDVGGDCKDPDCKYLHPKTLPVQ